jgi:hypothetical protein
MFDDENIIFRYTSSQAEADGILFDVTRINKAWENGLFNYVTTNLLNQCGYMDGEGQINIPNIIDLLNQCNQIVRRKSDNFKDFDTFFDGQIELPSGKKQKVFIGQNETGKFTIMLPEDY